MSDLQLQLGDILLRLSAQDPALVAEGLHIVDTLFGRLVLQANSDNPSPSSTSGSGTNNSNNSNTSSGSGNSSGGNGGDSKKKWRVPGGNDPVFGEFLILQDAPAYNLTARLIRLLPIIRSTTADRKFPDDTLLLFFKILQGCLLLHPASRDLFHHERNMLGLLNFISPSPPVYSSQVICSVIQTLVSCLVRNVPNLRLFETLNGPGIICNLLKYKPTSTDNNKNDLESSKEIQVKALEFLFFYLVPETHKFEEESHKLFETPSSSHSSRSSSPQMGDKQNDIHSNDYQDGFVRRTTKDKATILRQFLNKNITEGLVTELLENKPFGNMRNEW